MALKLNLRRTMHIANVTQMELSAKTGLTQANISAIVLGKASPRNATLSKIADALGMEIHELYDAPDEQTIYCPHCGGIIKIVKDVK